MKVKLKENIKKFVEMNPRDLKPYDNNARVHNIDAIADSIQKFGFKEIVCVDENNVIINGHGRVKASIKLGLEKIPVGICSDLTEEEKKAFRLLDNKVAELTEWDEEKLRSELQSIEDIDMSAFGDAINDSKFEKLDKSKCIGGLQEKFLAPPFSYLDTRLKYFKDRVDAWSSLGIKSEKGRNENVLDERLKILSLKNGCSIESAKKASVSIFNPALTEILYTWFSKKDDNVLDCFAGGSVRGIVADKTGRNYTGIELRKEQVEANVENAEELNCKNAKWICGDSNVEVDKLKNEYDFILSCPPYADLEVYSDNPADISNMEYSKFLEIYRSIIKKTCDKLKDDRFIAWVIGEVRNKKGNYYNFLGDTIKAFLDAGVNYYNEIILLNNVGTGGFRASRIFRSRKVVKLHQNVLIFVKGDWKKASERLGDVEVLDCFEDLES